MCIFTFFAFLFGAFATFYFFMVKQVHLRRLVDAFVKFHCCHFAWSIVLADFERKKWKNEQTDRTVICLCDTPNVLLMTSVTATVDVRVRFGAVSSSPSTAQTAFAHCFHGKQKRCVQFQV